MEKATLELPITIAKASERSIEKNTFFVIEGISEIGVFTQYCPIDFKEKYNEDETEYVLVFEVKKDNNKHGLRPVDLVQ